MDNENDRRLFKYCLYRKNDLSPLVVRPMSKFADRGESTEQGDSGEYVTGDKCASSGRAVNTESKCREAAKYLKLDFGRARSWTRLQRYCWIFENNNKVYFNKNDRIAPGRDPRLRTICVKGESSFT